MKRATRNRMIVVSAFLLLSLSCSVFGGAAEEIESAVDDIAESAEEVVAEAVEDAVEEAGPALPTQPEPPKIDSGSGDSEFPMPPGAENIMDVSGTTNYQVKMSLDEVIEFHRTEFAALGYTERDLLTTITEGGFSMVFDGAPNGMPIVVQGVDLGGGMSNVNIRYEDA